MTDLLISVLRGTVQISLLVLLMMIVVDLINVWTRGRISAVLHGGKRWRQYVITPLIGTVPGCVGAFTNASLYMHGMITFGSLTGGMAAVSGDEAFVMLALFPKTAIVLFGILLIVGIPIGWFTDSLIQHWNIKTCQDCSAELLHSDERGAAHYLKEHIWEHIVKRHLWKTSLWTVATLLVVKFGLEYWNLETLTSKYTLVLLIAGAFIGLIPESGPHLVFVSLYASGLIPFSVLLTSSIVQDGHGMLPMLAYSIKDSVIIKGFNLAFGLSIGLSLYFLGL